MWLRCTRFPRHKPAADRVDDATSWPNAKRPGVAGPFRIRTLTASALLVFLVHVLLPGVAAFLAGLVLLLAALLLLALALLLAALLTLLRLLLAVAVVLVVVAGHASSSFSEGVSQPCRFNPLRPMAVPTVPELPGYFGGSRAQAYGLIPYGIWA
jgi:hypothetical protein